MLVKWIFFDVGTTLVDEEKAYNHRVYDMIKDTNISFEEFHYKRVELARQGLDGNSAAIKFFNLNKTPWHSEDEVLYEDTIVVLEYLINKGYKLGVIANQKKGLDNRLEEFGILKYFDIVIASEEVGVSKPDKEIFYITLSKANCKPNDCVMVGDRLDNDIIPATEIGMKTIWIKQGLAKYQNNISMKENIDYTIDNLADLKKYF